MTDEEGVSPVQPLVVEPALEAPAEVAPEVASQHTEAAPPLWPTVSTEAIKEISNEITEAAQDAIIGRKTEAHEVSPLNSPTPSIIEAPIKAHHGEALARRREKKNEKLERTIVLAKEKDSITNRDVELLLHVSIATATRYLSELVKSGRLRRIGKRRAARYEPVI